MNKNKWTVASNYIWNDENIMNFARHAIMEKGLESFTSSLSEDGIKVVTNKKGYKDFELTQEYAHQIFIRNMGYEYKTLLKDFVVRFGDVKEKESQVAIAKEYIKVFEAVNNVYANNLDNDAGEIGRWSYRGIILTFSEGFGYNYDYRKTKEDVHITHFSTMRNSVEKGIQMATEINAEIERLTNKKNKTIDQELSR